MTLLFILALVQGLTEFLPVSSSAHLILVPHFLGYESHPFVWDVAAHAGSLVAVLLFYRHSLWQMSKECLYRPQWSWQRPGSDAHLALWLILATLPVVMVGGLGKSYIEGMREHLGVIAFTTIFFGLLLGWVDRKQGTGQAKALHWRDALWVGVMQSLAIVPGVSRSGIVITALLMLGMARVDSARIAMLMGIPTIAAATGLMGLDLLEQGIDASWFSVFVVMLLSMLTSLLVMRALLSWLANHSYLPFVGYRLVLGCVLLWFVMF